MNDKEIIKTLRTMSKKSNADAPFKSELLLELKSSLDEKRSDFILSFFSMKSLALAVLVLVLIGGGVFFYTNSQKETPKSTEVKVSTSVTETLPKKDDSGSLASGMMLAVDSWQTIEEAQASTSFNVLYPKIYLSGEGIASIETSQDFEGSDPTNDSYYITYAKSSKEFYKVSGSAWEREETQGEKVTIKGLTAYYYVIPGSELPTEGSIAIDAVGRTVKSFLFWNMNGKSYEISEFGEVSKDDLMKLAESMI